MGLGGNVWEWEESSFDLASSGGTSDRGIRGGDWSIGNSALSSSFRLNISPGALNYDNIGFRVVSLSSVAPAAVPEPSMMLIGTVIGLGGLSAKRRMKK
jgi:hypothetical protein